jgi:hypothetical protein
MRRRLTRSLVLAVLAAVGGVAALGGVPGSAADGDVGSSGVVDGGEPEVQVIIEVTGFPTGPVTIDLVCGATTSQLVFNAPGNQNAPAGNCVVAPGEDGGATTVTGPVTVFVTPLLTTVTTTFYFAPATDLEMNLTPGSGPSGTVINVQSVDPCPIGTNSVVVVLSETAGPLDTQTVAPGGDGHWQTSLTVPAGTNPQDLTVTATCDDAPVSTLATSGTYVPLSFTVTVAPDSGDDGGGTTNGDTTSSGSTTSNAAAPTRPVIAEPQLNG